MGHFGALKLKHTNIFHLRDRVLMLLWPTHSTMAMQKKKVILHTSDWLEERTQTPYLFRNIIYECNWLMNLWKDGKEHKGKLKRR